MEKESSFLTKSRIIISDNGFQLCIGTYVLPILVLREKKDQCVIILPLVCLWNSSWKSTIIVLKRNLSSISDLPRFRNEPGLGFLLLTCLVLTCAT